MDNFLSINQEDTNQIKIVIKQILSEYSAHKSSVEYITFRVRYFCPEMGIEFKKLFKFNKHEIAEKAAGWQWRSQWNQYKDHNLDFDKFINSEIIILRLHPFWMSLRIEPVDVDGQQSRM